MPLTFTRAPLVAAGDRITSTQMRGLARAWNDRLRAGPGDPAYRLAQYWVNLARQVRSPDGYAFPALAEFHEFYTHIKPESGLEWPTTEPGMPEGANLASPIMQYVWGVEDQPSEAWTLGGVPLHINGGPPATALEAWTLGKMQRGAYDPTTGARNAPALDASGVVFDHLFPLWSRHHKSYGGYLPQPTRLLEHCDDATDGDFYWVGSYQIVLTAQRADVQAPVGCHGTVTTEGGVKVVRYSGSCPCNSDHYGAGHVVGMRRPPASPLHYVVWVGTGSGCAAAVDLYPAADWVEGPYTGPGELSMPDGGQLQRAAWAFLADFRGGAEARGGHALLGSYGQPGTGSDAFPIEAVALPNQELITRQWPLAPALATLHAGELVTDYPGASWSGPTTVSAGTLGTFADGRTTHSVASGFVVAGFCVAATGLNGQATFTLKDGSRALATISITPDEQGAASAIAWLPAAVAATDLQIHATSGFVLQSGGWLRAEVAELLDYQPQWWDLALAARLGAAGGLEASGNVDGRGLDHPDHPSVTAGLFSHGALLNPQGAPGVLDQIESVTSNPVFDAARRLSNDHYRLLNRLHLEGYEVAVGKSILYLRRTCRGLDAADALEGIAPPRDPVPSGQLIEGEVYRVQGPVGGAVLHAGLLVGIGATFTAASTYCTYIGEAQVYVLDGIRHAARKRGWSNEWVMFPQFKAYNPSATSIYKPDAYADFFPFSERCFFHSGYVPDGAVRRHIGMQVGVELDSGFIPYTLPELIQNTLLAPEAPTGYRYAEMSNANGYTPAAFYQSCQIYMPPYEVESCVVPDWSDPDLVKLTFTTRFHSHPSAPSTVSRTPAAVSGSETYRTDDNAIREYLYSVTPGGAPASVRTGDQGHQSSLTGVNGTVYPHLHFVHLVPMPYDDGNDTNDPHDTRCTTDTLIHCEVLTRACCEGFVDGLTSASLICATGLGGIYDYSYEALCQEAFGGSWIGMTSLTTRGDNMAGYGPLPNTHIEAEVFNRLSTAVNLLTRARIPWPVQFTYYTTSRSGSVPTACQGDPCSPNGTWAAWADGVSAPDCTSVDSVSGPYTGYALQPSWQVQLGGCPFGAASIRIDIDFVLKIPDAYLQAVPTYLQDLLSAGYGGFVARRTRTQQHYTRTEVTLSNPWTCGASSTAKLQIDGTWHYYDWILNSSTPVDCVVVSGGTIVAEPPHSSDLPIGHSAEQDTGVFCLYSANSIYNLELLVQDGSFVTVPLVDP
jgi:hypothetical protein